MKDKDNIIIRIACAPKLFRCFEGRYIVYRFCGQILRLVESRGHKNQLEVM